MKWAELEKIISKMSDEQKGKDVVVYVDDHIMESFLAIGTCEADSTSKYDNYPLEKKHPYILCSNS